MKLKKEKEMQWRKWIITEQRIHKLAKNDPDKLGDAALDILESVDMSKGRLAPLQSSTVHTTTSPNTSLHASPPTKQSTLNPGYKKMHLNERQATRQEEIN